MPPQIKLAAKIFAGPGLFSLALLSGIAKAGAGLYAGSSGWRWKRPIVSAPPCLCGGTPSRFSAVASWS
jgi:hypothetical protein